MDKIIVGVVLAFIAVIIGAFCALFIGFLVMISWNAVMPEVFGLSTINYIQGFWMSFLSSLLFKTTSSSTSN